MLKAAYFHLLRTSAAQARKGLRMTRADIDARLRGRGSPLLFSRPHTQDALTVAAVAREICEVSGARPYIDRMDDLFARVVSAGARMIVLPEHNWLDLAFAGSKKPERHSADNAMTDKEIAALSEALFSMAPHLNRIATDLFSLLAQRHDCYALSGVFPEWEPKSARLFLTAYLFSPQGRVILKQRKLQPSGFERKLGFSGGNSVAVTKAEGFTVACVIGGDALAFEPFQYAAMQGADLFLLPQAVSQRSFMADELSLGRIQARLQGAYAARAPLVGSLGGRQYVGAAAIWGGDAQGGAVVETRRPSGEYVACATITVAPRARPDDDGALAGLLGDRNPAFEANFGQWYQKRNASAQ